MAQYPYTNFHDFNLDWILDQIKTMLAEWQSTRADWNALQQDHDALRTEWTAFKAEILAFVDENVPVEVANVIRAMADDGTLLQIITEDEGEGSALSDAVGAWLAAHITQETGYVVDTSLTVTGAAADAKTVGDKFGTVVSYDETQSASDTQKTTARTNIGAISAADVLKSTTINISGRYIPASSSAERIELDENNYPVFSTNANARIYFAECSEGDEFIISGLRWGTNTPLLLFIAEDGTILQRVSPATEILPTLFIAPTNTKWIQFLRSSAGATTRNEIWVGSETPSLVMGIMKQLPNNG